MCHEIRDFVANLPADLLTLLGNQLSRIVEVGMSSSPSMVIRHLTCRLCQQKVWVISDRCQEVKTKLSYMYIKCRVKLFCKEMFSFNWRCVANYMQLNVCSLQRARIENTKCDFSVVQYMQMLQCVIGNV